MKAVLTILWMLMLLISLGCSPSKNTTYVPSITSLALDETLVMTYQSCHNGCTKGIVKFRNGEAIIGRNSLELTTKEIADLDSYFLLGVDDEWLCSIIIEISFKHKKGFHTLGSKGVQTFPCFIFIDYPLITPERLVTHLNKSPDEIPYWRLSQEEKYKKIEALFE